MPLTDPDVVVIGAGPNGLVAACVLAKRGLRVLVLESNPRRPGGAVGSEEATRPGFVHDVGAAFFPFATKSPAFRELALDEAGVEWLFGRVESCHPAPDGSVAAIRRGFETTDTPFGSDADFEAFRRLAEWHAKIEPAFLSALLLPFPSFGPVWSLGPSASFKLARIATSSGRALSSRLFDSEAARRVLPSLALHVDVGPDDRFGAALGYVLGLTATTGGYPVPRGGAQQIANALVRILETHGGRVQLGARVDRVIVRDGRAAAVRTSGGEEISANEGVLADTSAPKLFLDLLDRDDVSERVLRRMETFEQGWGTFKMDWALTAPVPWASEVARQSAVVHAGDSLDDLSRFTAQVRRGEIPDHPYLVVGQQSVVDPSRAPANQHTLWCYTRVPSNPERGWATHRDRFADVIEDRIEGLAPGFKQKVIERRVVAPPDLQAMDENLTGGDIGGGSNAWNRQLIWRPMFPHFRYRMPIRGLYLCSSYAHPGAGVHGMCGYNAATVAMQDIG